MEKSNLNYVIYCRRSQESRERQVLSIESQIRELKEYALKENLQVVDVLKESQSAYKPGRPVFNQMMDKIEAGDWQGILTWKPDRLARNALDGGRVIQAIDDGHLLEIRTTFECFRKEANRLMLYIHFGMSNDYSRQISANVKRGNRQKYERGEYLGKAPVGYENTKIDAHHNIILSGGKSGLVKRLFEEFATGQYSVADIVRLADKRGLKSVFGKPIAKSGMYTLLQRTAYYGVYKHGGEYHQGTYEPLITKELFDKVQGALAERSKPRKKDWFHAYKGLIRCADCGCAITAETKRKYYKGTHRHAAYTYYRCTKRRGECSQKAVTESELEEMMFKMVSNIFLDKEVWDLGVKLLRKKHEAESLQHESLRKGWEKEFSRAQKNLEKLLDLRMADEIGKDEYAKKKKEMLDEREQLKERIEDCDSGSLGWLELAETFFEKCYQAREIMESDDFLAKRNLIRDIGSNLLLEDKKLSFSLKKPYDVLLKPGIREDVQARQDSNLEEGFWRPP